ncbi:MAG: hypothetical protein E6Q97_11485 [Desulfurellales bacterium]|nr:MAG: hypothetical protein E6Q97_11485 [Desulfurellales bacterium]
MKHILTALVTACMTLAVFSQTPITTSVSMNPTNYQVRGSSTNFHVANADRGVATVGTLATLTAVSNALHGSVVDVRGRVTDGDLETPLRFVLNTNSAVATNEIVIANAGGSGRWLHPWDGNVRAFGALPFTTNGAAIQAACDYAVANRKTLYFPSDANGGIYYTDRTIIMTNVSNNRVLGGGIRGDGIGRSRLYHTGFNESVLKIRGLGMVVDGMTIGFKNIQGNTNTSAICLELPGFNSAHDIANCQFVNGYVGIKATSDDSGYAAFSMILRNITIENCDQGGDMPTGSGNLYHNIYITAYGLPSATRAWIDRSGLSRYDQFNIEHSNYRASPLVFQGSGGSFGHLHYEGNRMINSEPIMSIQQATVDVEQFSIINSYFNGHLLSAITRSGTTATATVDDMGDAISGGHGIAVGDTVYILGATDALYNGAKTVDSVTTTNFTYTMSGTPAADAVVDLASYDYLSANRGTASSTLSSILDTTLYENPRLKIKTLKIRDNRIVNALPANRVGILAANELNGRMASMSVDEIDTGAPSDPLAGRYLAANPVVAISVASSNATVWTRYPHLFSTNELAYFQANTPARRTSTNWTVLTVPTPWSFTVNIGGSDLALTREVGAGFCAPVVTTITNLARSGNIATAMCSTPHYLKIGYKGAVYNAALSGFTSLNLAALTIPDAYTFTYRSVGSDAGAAAETQAVLAVYDAGLSEFLAVSTQSPLKDFGHLFRQTTALSSNTIAAGSYDLTTNTLNGARVGDVTSLGLLSASAFDPDIVLSSHVNSANSIVIRRMNVGVAAVTNLANVLSVVLIRQ